MDLRINYIKNLYKDENLLKAATWLLIYKPSYYFDNYGDEECVDVYTCLLKTDCYGIQILKKPKLYDTEIKPELLKLVKMNKSSFIDENDLLGSFKEYLFTKTPMHDNKWFILEYSYRAYSKFNKIDDNISKFDFRECKPLKQKFNKFTKYILEHSD